MKMFVVLLITLQILLSVDCKLEDADEKCLKIANVLRALHQNTGMLEWNTELASAAQVWANHLNSTGQFEHEDRDARGYVGENLYKMTSQRTATCADAQLAWYKEFDNYDYTTHQSTNGEHIGHFAQVVWKASTQLGIGLAKKTLPDGYIETIIVARYNPAGNYYITYQRDDFYGENVLERKPGAETPTLYDLDSSLCYDFDDSLCPYYEQEGYCDIIKSSCPVSCNLCQPTVQEV